MRNMVFFKRRLNRWYKLCGATLIVGTLSVSCAYTNTHESLLVAEKVIDENPDSTLQILKGIDYNSLGLNKSKALFGLLYTSATYKCQNILNNDSLIDYSIKIFKEENDLFHLADSYYYKGAMNYARKQYAVSVKSLKEAETLSKESGYNQILNKIYELLIYVNYVSDNKSLRMEYSKKFMKSSITMNDNALIARAFAMVASSYAAMNMQDSAYAYIKNGLCYIDNANSTLKADLLVYAGEMYYEKEDFGIATKYALESDSVFPNSHAKMLLGKIEFQEGNLVKAEHLWNEALSTNDLKLKKRLYRMLSHYYAEVAQYNQAYVIALKIDSLNNENDADAKKIQELQLNYDRARVETKLYKKLTYLFAIVILTCASLLGLLKYHKKKMKSYNNEIGILSGENDAYKSKISGYSEKVTMYQSEIGLYVSKISSYENDIKDNIEKINILKISDRTKQKELESLKDNISTLYQSIMSEMRKGCSIYETIKNKKPIVRYTDEDLNSLIDFYKIIKGDIFSNWLIKYYPLSIRQYLFLILEEMGYNDYDISDILGVTDTTVRSTRSRIKKKIRS